MSIKKTDQSRRSEEILLDSEEHKSLKFVSFF
jgi:hypothetical protein